MRDPILEGVEAAGGTPSGTSGGSRSLPLAGALFGLGAAVGYLAGQDSSRLEDVSLEDVEEPEIIEDVAEEVGESVSEAEAEMEEGDSSSSWLGRLLLVLGALAGVALLRRRFAGEETDEWEPIEEFEPATDLGGDEDEGETEEGEDEEEDAEEVEADTGEETEE